MRTVSPDQTAISGKVSPDNYNKLAALPEPNAPFAVDTSVFFGSSNLDSKLKELGRFKQLKYLRLYNVNLGDTGCKALSDLTRLEWLGLLQSRIDEKGFKHLGQQGHGTAFTMVICTHHQGDILERHHKHQCPKHR